jgi:hypothetical protein
MWRDLVASTRPASLSGADLGAQPSIAILQQQLELQTRSTSRATAAPPYCCSCTSQQLSVVAMKWWKAHSLALGLVVS